jgi:hypothetical protein
LAGSETVQIVGALRYGPIFGPQGKVKIKYATGHVETRVNIEQPQKVIQ